MLYAVDTGLPIFRFEGDPRAILDLAWSPDGRTLVAALSAHTMRVWDARDGHLIRKNFGQHSGPVNSVAFSPDGRTIASASYDRTIKLWEAAPVSALAPTGEAPVAASQGDRPAPSPGTMVAYAR